MAGQHANRSAHQADDGIAPISDIQPRSTGTLKRTFCCQPKAGSGGLIRVASAETSKYRAVPTSTGRSHDAQVPGPAMSSRLWLAMEAVALSRADASSATSRFSRASAMPVVGNVYVHASEVWQDQRLAGAVDRSGRSRRCLRYISTFGCPPLAPTACGTTSVVSPAHDPRRRWLRDHRAPALKEECRHVRRLSPA